MSFFTLLGEEQLATAGLDRLPGKVQLRDVVQSDLPIFFDHQQDPDANAMAAFPAREIDAFEAHWAKILRDGTLAKKTIVFDGHIAGNVVSFPRDGKKEIGYWIGKPFWGKGIATRALAQFLAHETERPLYAGVAKHNAASIRVLEKCGFTISDEDDHSPAIDDGVEEVVLILRE